MSVCGCDGDSNTGCDAPCDQSLRGQSQSRAASSSWGGVYGATPARPLLFDDAGSGEGRHACGAALLDQRVSALACELAVGQRPVPRFGELDQRGAAEPEFSFPASDDEPLDPAAGAGGLDEEVQPLPVAVPAGRGVAYAGGRQGLVGMASSGLGFSGCAGRMLSAFHHPIGCGHVADCARRPGRLWATGTSDK